MKSILLVISVIAAGAWAQTTSIHDIKATEDTTISIKKGQQTNMEKAFEIVEGNGDIEGDPNVLIKSARDEWKKACESWKNEIKDLNKENQILVVNCDAPACKSEASGTVCKSTGSYKLKVKIVK
jgi:hypothetical protein